MEMEKSIGELVVELIDSEYIHGVDDVSGLTMFIEKNIKYRRCGVCGERIPISPALCSGCAKAPH